VTPESGSTVHAAGENYDANGLLNLPIMDDVLALRLVACRSHEARYINQSSVGVGIMKNDPNGTLQPVAALGSLAGVVYNSVEDGRS